MVRDCRFFTMKKVRSTNLTTITSLMNSIKRMAAKGLLLFWCTCKISNLAYGNGWIWHHSSLELKILNLLSVILFPLLIFGWHPPCRSDVEEGGETIFPAARGNFSSLPGWNERSECGKRGLSVKPRMGDALLFWSMRPDATLDSSSLHGWLTLTPLWIKNLLSHDSIVQWCLELLLWGSLWYLK